MLCICRTLSKCSCLLSEHCLIIYHHAPLLNFSQCLNQVEIAFREKKALILCLFHRETPTCNLLSRMPSCEKLTQVVITMQKIALYLPLKSILSLMRKKNSRSSTESTKKQKFYLAVYYQNVKIMNCYFMIH